MNIRLVLILRGQTLLIPLTGPRSEFEQITEVLREAVRRKFSKNDHPDGTDYFVHLKHGEETFLTVWAEEVVGYYETDPDDDLKREQTQYFKSLNKHFKEHEAEENKWKTEEDE